MGSLRKEWDETDTLVTRLVVVGTIFGSLLRLPSLLWWTDGIACGMMLARWLLTHPG